MEKLIAFIFHSPTTAPRSTVILRLMAGSVFLWEGLLKLALANQGVGRFTKLGLPFPFFTAHFVAGLEIVGGVLLLAGLLTRAIAIPFIIEMIVAILSTKIALYLGHSPLPPPPSPPVTGLWAVLHEVRSEWAQLATVSFLLLVGPGSFSVDAWLARRRKSGSARALPGGVVAAS